MKGDSPPLPRSPADKQDTHEWTEDQPHSKVDGHSNIYTSELTCELLENLMEKNGIEYEKSHGIDSCRIKAIRTEFDMHEHPCEKILRYDTAEPLLAVMVEKIAWEPRKRKSSLHASGKDQYTISTPIRSEEYHTIVRPCPFRYFIGSFSEAVPAPDADKAHRVGSYLVRGVQPARLFGRHS